MEIMNEIDRLIASMGTEKAESDQSVHPEVVLDGNQSSDYDPDFLNSILNEVVEGNVSKLNSTDNQSSDYDPDFLDSILNEVGGNVSKLNNADNVQSATALPSILDEQSARLEVQDVAPFDHSNSAVFNQVVSGTDFLAKPQETDGTTVNAAVTVTYQLGDQQVIILPAKLSPDQNVPVVVADTWPFQLTSDSNNLPSATAVIKNLDGEATAPTTGVSKQANLAGSRKRKLYEEDEFSDPEKEKKRQNAINAFNYRKRTKQEIKDLQEKLNTKDQECVALAQKVQEMEMMLEEQQSAHSMEITTLKKSNEELMHKLQIWQSLVG